ncbi:MAG: DUF59 domain-containing protein [Bacteroidales bacterium]|nr:DUF59 domain-containing protein [Bacteroidales bacterium]
MDVSHFSSIELQVVEVLKTIYDPEMPVNIWDMGLIYKLSVDADNKAYVLMTLTAPNCPVAETLPSEVKQKVAAVPQIVSAEVEVTFEPVWDMDMMSDEAKLELGFLF